MFMSRGLSKVFCRYARGVTPKHDPVLFPVSSPDNKLQATQLHSFRENPPKKPENIFLPPASKASYDIFPDDSWRLSFRSVFSYVTSGRGPVR